MPLIVANTSAFKVQMYLISQKICISCTWRQKHTKKEKEFQRWFFKHY